MIVFREDRPGKFDLLIDGRAADYEIEPSEFGAALRRSRVDTSKHQVFIEDLTGYRERLGR